MKILLTGGTGMLGSAIADELTRAGRVFLAPRSQEMDITDPAAVTRYAKAHNPDIIINTVAYTAVDKAETDQSACFALNTQAVEHLVARGLPIIHFSTDYVFGVGHDHDIPEGTAPAPLNYYGLTKAEGERVLEASGIPFWNIRIGWLYGDPTKDFFGKIFARYAEHGALQVVEDQFGRPTYAPDVAHALVQHFLPALPTSGHYHFVPEGDAASWADVADIALKAAGIHDTCARVPSTHFQTAAPRPRNSRLGNTKLSFRLPDWHGRVEKYTQSIS